MVLFGAVGIAESMRYLRFLNKAPQNPRGSPPLPDGGLGLVGLAGRTTGSTTSGSAAGLATVAPPETEITGGVMWPLRWLADVLIDRPPGEVSSEVWVSSTSLAYSLRNSWRMNWRSSLGSNR